MSETLFVIEVLTHAGKVVGWQVPAPLAHQNYNLVKGNPEYAASRLLDEDGEVLEHRALSKDFPEPEKAAKKAAKKDPEE